MTMLVGHKILNGTLVCLSGVRIGASRDSMEVGGIDNPIIRHPITHLPYIPGSSLKGKVRSLLEQKYCSERVMSTGTPCNCGESTCKVCVVFGCGDPAASKTPTRAIFRDCNLTENSKQILEEARRDLGVFYSETKTEVVIDRRTVKAHDRIGRRNTERIPEGTELDFEIVLRVFEGDPVDQYVQFIKEGITLLENDTLGGSGTRGYGKVKVKDLVEKDV